MRATAIAVRDYPLITSALRGEGVFAKIQTIAPSIGMLSECDSDTTE